MGQTAEELRERLDRQRDELGRDLDAVGDRVSPGRIVDRRRAAARESFGRARNAVMGTADTAASTTTDRVKDAASAVGDAASAAPRAITSGTQGNIIAHLAWCRGGDEVICGDTSHTLTAEQANAARVAQTQLRTVPQNRGSLDIEAIKRTIRGDDPHWPRT